MARVAEMALVELMVLKEDIAQVVEHLGRSGVFQFQRSARKGASPANGASEANKADKTDAQNAEKDFFDRLQSCRAFLNIEDVPSSSSLTDAENCRRPTEEDKDEAQNLIANVDSLKERMEAAVDEEKRVSDTYRETMAFANLKASYSELEHLSFLSLRIGRIESKLFDELKDAVGNRAIIVPLGEDKSHIMAASAKKGRFALDTELKAFGFVPLELPKDFKGVPDDVLEGLKAKKEQCKKAIQNLAEERDNFAQTHKDRLLSLLLSFSLGMQITDILQNMEATSLVYHLTGWVPQKECHPLMQSLDKMTQGRIAIREYLPSEVPAVMSGKERVPVMVKHGKFVSGFERMIFSYGAPVYGTVDPTPFVAIFFTLLFGVMFGDAGQGLVILLFGILLAKGVIKIGGYAKCASVFIAVGASSMFMGLLTGEFFATEGLLRPFAMFVTGLFGEPHSPILRLMPSSTNTKAMFVMFGVAVAMGFVINSAGIVINIVNKLLRKKRGEAIFGKCALSGALFFWYIVAMVLRMVLFGHKMCVADIVVIGVLALLSAFGEPLSMLVDGERPIAPNGMGSLFISGMVELIEVVSTYLSNSVSFLRVGAFALSHAVLGYIIVTMTELSGPIGGTAVLVIGNAIVVVLEGMIVAIQVVRLQYYEFFSKFFNETGVEFKPLKFVYGC